jgi:hypothetical protein
MLLGDGLDHPVADQVAARLGRQLEVRVPRVDFPGGSGAFRVCACIGLY